MRNSHLLTTSLAKLPEMEHNPDDFLTCFCVNCGNVHQKSKRLPTVIPDNINQGKTLTSCPSCGHFIYSFTPRKLPLRGANGSS